MEDDRGASCGECQTHDDVIGASELPFFQFHVMIGDDVRVLMLDFTSCSLVTTGVLMMEMRLFV